MQPTPQPGDILLTGINGQAFVSLAIKLGSVLRFQKTASRVAGLGQLMTMVITIAAIVKLDWPWYSSIGVALLGFIVSCAVVWLVATILKDKTKPWGRYSHAALVIDYGGEPKIAEALAHGVSISNMTPDGRPMAKVEMAASELIPTGQYANIVVGPGRLTVFVDPKDSDPLPEADRENIAKAMNLVAELVEVDVIAVQRNLVLENMQANLANDKD